MPALRRLEALLFLPGVRALLHVRQVNGELQTAGYQRRGCAGLAQPASLRQFPTARRPAGSIYEQTPLPVRALSDTAAGLGFLHSGYGAIIVANDAPRWTIVAVNDAYLAVTHSARGSLVGRPLFDAFPQNVQTTDERGAHHVEDSLIRAARGEPNRPPVLRYDIRADDGTDEFVARYWQLSSTPLRDDAGEIVAVLHEVENVTALRIAEAARATLLADLEAQTEELQVVAAQLEERTEEAELARHAAESAEGQLMTVLQQTPAAIGVTLGREHRFIVANRGYEELIGRRVTRGTTFAESMPELVAQGFEALLTQVFESGVPFVASEAHAKVAKAGMEPQDGWYDFVYQPLVDATGHVIGVLQQGIDVTRLVALRKAAEEARALAENANAAKGEFLAVMSHELRTPLNAIEGYAVLMETGIRGPLTDIQREDLSRIRKSQRHLLGLIDEVLNYVRLEAGMLTYDITDVLVAEALSMCEALIAPQMGAKGLQFTMRPCDASWTVRADSAKLRQIVVNLLTNAMKFTDRGGRVELECTRTESATAISVHDTGQGIPEAQRERIFEPFVQVDAGLTRKQSGVGLGLSISRNLARGMGGELAIVETGGEGSTFTITLPS